MNDFENTDAITKLEVTLTVKLIQLTVALFPSSFTIVIVKYTTNYLEDT